MRYQLPALEALQGRNLTLREQTRLASNPDQLRWQAIFPRRETRSIRISEITQREFRPIGLRREWNAQGHEIPDVLPPRRDFEMIPINPKHTFDEHYLQLLTERTEGVDSVAAGIIMKDVDEWASILAGAAYRQIEVDAFEAWALGQITVLDPVTKEATVVSLGLDAARYVAEGEAWNVVTGGAYARLVYHLDAAQDMLGGVGAIRMRRATLNTVVATAPTSTAIPRVTAGNIEQVLEQEGYGEVRVIIDERTYDKPTTNPLVTSPTKYVPTGRVLFQPPSGVVGATHFAPVARAFEYASKDRRVNRNDVALFLNPQNNGKTLEEEAQLNAIPMPIEQAVYVVNAGF
ncbi:MAG TPA: hypothetical protein VD838_00575 [Anaeromyxobacteraceae bacterium]|nr:hypothetical protein [Anaeromyxobacteraceae bacterium]